jgi:cell volume regulation protein A
MEKTGNDVGVELPDEIDTDLTDLTITPDMLSDGDTLKEITLPDGALVMIVKRGTEFLVPNGSLHLQAGDKLLLISER